MLRQFDNYKSNKINLKVCNEIPCLEKLEGIKKIMPLSVKTV